MKKLNLTSKEKSDEMVRYVLLTDNPTFYFYGYTDWKGNEVRLDYERNQKGKYIHRKLVTFSNGYYTVHKSQTKLIDFIDNSPWCADSPNQKGKVLFRRLDITKDALDSVMNKAEKIKATAKAIELEGDELKTIAIMC